MTDFGLAKRATDANLTLTGVVMGTPAYMAPEQAIGNAKFVGPAADVYALGVILYECLTGRPPFLAADTGAILARVAHDDPPPVRRFARDVPADLELICLKCLAKSPAERYGSAASLADDLNRFLSGEPVSVRPAGALEKSVKWVRRYPTRAIAYGLTLLTAALLGLTTSALKLWRDADAAKRFAFGARDAAEAQRGEADGARQEAVTAKSRAEVAEERLSVEASHRTVELANRAFEGLDVVRVRESLAACRTDLRSWGWHYLNRAVTREVRTVPTGDTDTFSLAVAADGRVASCGTKGVRVWEPGSPDARQLSTTPHHTVAFSRDGRRLLANNMMSRATVYDTATWAEVSGYPAAPACWFTISPTGDRVLTSNFFADGQMFDEVSGKLIRTVPFDFGVLCGEFSPDGETVAVGGAARTGKAGPGGGTVHLLPANGGAPRHILAPHGSRVQRLRYSPDGSRLASIAQDGSVRVWDAETGRPLTLLPASAVEAWSVAFSPDNARLVTASADRTVRVWDVRSGIELFTFRGHTAGVGDVAFTPDGQRVLSVGADATLREWDVSGRPDRVRLAFLPPAVPFPRAPVLLSDGQMFVGGDVQGGCFDTRTGAAGPVLSPPPPAHVRAAVVSPDGARLSAVMPNGDVWEWDLRTGKGSLARQGNVVAKPDPHGVGAASADLSRLLVRSDAMRVIDAASGAVICTLTPRPTGDYRAAALSADGTRVATGGIDRKTHIWDGVTGQPLFQLPAHGNRVRAVAFSQDGTRIATASDDGWVQVWDVASKRDVLTVRCRGAGSELMAVAFGPDGTTLVVVDTLGTAFFLDAAPPR